jgi:hypothetical protein
LGRGKSWSNHPAISPIGYIYCTPGKRRERGCELLTPDQVRDILTGEVRVYSRWLNDERYGYRLRVPNGRPITTTYGYDDKTKCLQDGMFEARKMGLDIESTVDKIER